MRLTGQEKLGYYPTPVSLMGVISSYLGKVKADLPVRLLDPCCGYGEALACVAQSLGQAETWGAELSDERAVGAARVLTKVHHTGWQSCRVGRGIINLLWLNPPYDFVPQSSMRQEEQFLFDSTAALSVDGVLVYIIPHEQLRNPNVAKHLAGRFDQIRIERFPDEEYAAFKQVVVFARRRAKYQPPTDQTIAAITRLALLDPTHLPVITHQDSPVYLLPPAPDRDVDGKAPMFKRLFWSDEDLVAAAEQQGVQARSHLWKDRLSAIDIEHHIEPAMPLKKGHVAMLIASGLMGVMTLTRTNEDGATQVLLAKGRVIKDKESTTETVQSGDQTMTKTVERDKFVTTVSTLDEHGQITVIKDAQGLGAFMQEFGEQLAKQVIAIHQPAYDLKPLPQEWEAISALAHTMRLPGRAETGLLDAQKHVAIAAMRGLRKHRCMILNCEMGFGKSVSAAAVATVAGATYLSTERMGAWPVVVVCPPHLVRKWAKEFERAIPDCVARVVNCVERKDAPEDDTHELSQCHKSKLPPYSIMDFVRDYKAGRLGSRAVAIVSRERAKLGSGWAPVAVVRKQALQHVEVDADGIEHPVKQVIEYLADPDTGQLLHDDDREQPMPLRNNPQGWEFLARRQRMSNSQPMPGWALGNDGRRTGSWGKRLSKTPCFTMAQGIGDYRNLPTLCNGKWVVPEQRANLENKVGFRRYPIADFIHRKLKGFFKLFIADECHEFKGADSDQAIAFHKISRACKYTLGLTGSLFGGKSTNLLYLLHRTIPAVRAEYGHRDERRWATNLGVLETTSYDEAKSEDDEQDSALRGNTRRRPSVRELPGISPAIIRFLLPQVVFARITDLGYGLPPYEEDIVRLDMDVAQAGQYYDKVYDPRHNQGQLYNLMISELKKGSHRLLSVWLQAALSRPNSGFREDLIEAVKDKKSFLDTEDGAVNAEILKSVGKRRDLLKKRVQYQTLMRLPPIVPPNDWLPKERYLARFVSDELAQGRRVLIYCRQTGEKDIQPRVAAALQAVGVRTKILRATVPPDEREAWLEQNCGEIDALITNAKIVQTGLDLVMFHSVVFYEPDYSLFVLWQAMRRVWRLGQTKPVKVKFLSYNNTLEALAWNLMGQKLYAAQLLYGDEVGGAIVESDDGSFLTELARKALKGVQVQDLTQMFASANQGDATHTAETWHATLEAATTRDAFDELLTLLQSEDSPNDLQSWDDLSELLNTLPCPENEAMHSPLARAMMTLEDLLAVAEPTLSKSSKRNARNALTGQASLFDLDLTITQS